MNRIYAGCCCLLMIFCTSALAGVNVIKKAPVLATKTFDPAAPPKEMPPLSEHEVALTDAGFSAGVLTETQNAINRRTEDGFEVTLNLQYIRVTIALRITIWVPKGVSDKVMAHEKGHQQISEDVWSTAEKRAKAAALPLVGQSFTGHGKTLKEATTDALHQASTEFLKSYNPDVGGKALTVNNTYDELTAHGNRAVPVEADAIEQAFAQYDADHPDAPHDAGPPRRATKKGPATKGA